MIPRPNTLSRSDTARPKGRALAFGDALGRGMKFPYKKFVVQSRPSGPASVVARPVIPIHVAAKQRVAYEALVDSGADYSIFHAQIG